MWANTTSDRLKSAKTLNPQGISQVSKCEFSKFLISRCPDKAFQGLSFKKKILQKNISSVQSYWMSKFTTHYLF